MMGEPLKHLSKMNLAGESSARVEHLTGKRQLSDQLVEDKSCNKHNANKRMKHHQERRFSNSGRVDQMSSSSSSDESDDNSSPFNLAKPINKNVTTTNSQSLKDDKQAHRLDSSDQRRKTIPVDEGNDDSSSTSNCSCEDHANEDEADFHEKLDYDDDSSPSPIASSSSYNNNNNSHVPISSSERSSLATTTATEEKVSIASKEYLDTKEERPHKQSTSSLKPSHHPSSDLKMKSVINHKPVMPNRSNESTRTDADISSPKSYHSLLRYLFKDACFFQMKSINHENIKISKSMGIWSTPIPNEHRLNLAFKQHRNVILIFSVQQSGGFQGFARMISESEPAARPLPWVLPERLSSKALRGVFNVQWICKKELPFHLAHDLYNPYNDNKPIKVARDGQQVESKVGKKLCKLFPEDDRERLSEAVSQMKHQVSQRKKYPNRYEQDSYPYAYRQGSDNETWRRDPFPIDHPPHHHHHHHHDNDYHRRPNDHPNFNYQRTLEPHNFASFNGGLRIPTPGPYHHPYHHNPFHNPPYPPQLPMDHYANQDVWVDKPVVLRHQRRDHRSRR